MQLKQQCGNLEGLVKRAVDNEVQGDDHLNGYHVGGDHPGCGGRWASALRRPTGPGETQGRGKDPGQEILSSTMLHPFVFHLITTTPTPYDH